MTPFAGFPDNSRYTPVPNLLFGQVLEEIDDPLALKCFLRVFWLHSQKKGYPRFLTQGELLSDRTLARVVSASGESIEAALEAALENTVKFGLLLHLRVESASGLVDAYVPNTQDGRRAAQRLRDFRLDVDVTDDRRAMPGVSSVRPNIFSLYEKNIGIITPIIAEELKEAEGYYPEGWIDEAFREAVVRNKRSWRYIEAILKRWKTEGKSHGEPWGHSKKVDAREWIRRHGLPKPPG